MELDKIEPIFTSYAVILDGDKTRCIVRKAAGAPPVVSRKHIRKNIEEDTDYMHNILDYIGLVAKSQREKEPVPDKVDGGYVYSFVSIDLMGKDPQTFLDDYEVSITLAKIAGDM